MESERPFGPNDSGVAEAGKTPLPEHVDVDGIPNPSPTARTPPTAEVKLDIASRRPEHSEVLDVPPLIVLVLDLETGRFRTRCSGTS